jgi:hypothetical protein
MKQDVETQFHTIDLFVRSILDDISNISKSTTKANMLAYMESWRTELTTIQHIIDL